MRFKITCEGKSPLLMDKISEETLKSMRDKNYQPPKLDLSPEQEAEAKIYTNGGKTPGIPAECLYACLVNAGRYLKHGKKQISTQKETILPSLLNIEETFLDLNNGAKWKVDMRAGRNDKGALLALVRPRFDNWSFDVTISIDDKEANAELIRQLFNIAGNKVGLLSFRPQKKGPFGRFAVKNWEELKN